jgi:hypothetical protein
MNNNLNKENLKDVSLRNSNKDEIYLLYDNKTVFSFFKSEKVFNFL